MIASKKMIDEGSQVFSKIIGGAKKYTNKKYKHICFDVIVIENGAERHEPTRLTFTCSKSIIETLEKNVKYVQS